SMSTSPQNHRTLFNGSPEAAKTFAARLAEETQKEIYRIDMSTIVSKFIGETEKTIDKLFAEADQKGCILFFDEAEALFGKRTDVKDAHDKYANQEVAY